MNPRIIRVLGSAMLVLGFASAIMRTQLDMDTVLTSWMGGAQPFSGIAMGVVGLGVMVLGNRLMKAREERLDRLESVESLEQPASFARARSAR